jgi:hypothetical protein
MLAFTIQWYFLMKKFWYCINLTDSSNKVTLGQNPYNIRLSGIPHIDYKNGSTTPVVNDDMQYFTLGSAIACAISMFVILFPMVGRIGPGESLVICFFGNIFYTLN